MGASPVQFVDYSQLGEQGALPTLPPGEACLAGPAVVWAAESQRNPFCSAILLGEKLLLLGESGLRVLRTDLPFSVQCATVNGAWIGMAGNTACLLNENNLLLVDIAGPGSEGKTCQIEDGPFQVIMDGPVIYLTTPKGIQCIKSRSGERVFDVVEWPAGAVPKPPKDAAAAAAMPSPNPNDPFATPYQTMGPYRTPTYAPPGQQDQNWRQPATLGHVERGVLYTVSLPGRVVAIGEAAK